MSLNWESSSKKRGPRTRGYDVSVNVNKAGLLASGEQRWAAVFRFSLEGLEKLAVNSGYMEYVWEADRKRIYFRGSDNINGYKITSSNKGKNTYQIACAAIYPESLMKYKGVYVLNFDKTEGYYYIDLTKNLSKTTQVKREATE